MHIENTQDIFQLHRLIWKYSGCTSAKNHTIVYFMWVFLFYVGAGTFSVHMIIGLIDADSRGDFFKNISITTLILQCCFKFVIIWSNLENIHLVESIFTALHNRIQSIDEQMYFLKIARSCKYMLYIFGFTFISGLIFLLIKTVIGGERELLYPGWLPFDWRNSMTKYWIGYVYQFLGITLLIPLNFANDTYPAITLAAISGHARLLGIRVSKLGTDATKSLSDNNEDLRMCIKDHERLIEIYYMLNKILSKGMFCQILGTALSMCFSIVCLFFFADTAFALIYYSVIIVLTPLEIFPSCYYGSAFETEFNSLPYALFLCNWIDQDKSFKLNMIIFSQRCFQATPFVSMGIFRIHLDTFFATMRSAYSLLAIIIKLR